MRSRPIEVLENPVVLCISMTICCSRCWSTWTRGRWRWRLAWASSGSRRRRTSGFGSWSAPSSWRTPAVASNNYDPWSLPSAASVISTPTTFGVFPSLSPLPHPRRPPRRRLGLRSLRWFGPNHRLVWEKTRFISLSRSSLFAITRKWISVTEANCELFIPAFNFPSVITLCRWDFGFGLFPFWFNFLQFLDFSC